MKQQQQKFEVRWFDAIPCGFVAAMIAIWLLDVAPDPKWGLTGAGWIVCIAFGAACGLAAYLWRRSRQPKP